MSPNGSSIDLLEALLARSRPSIEELFRRQAVSVEEAEDLLTDALAQLESLHGVVPGSGQRLLKGLEAACARLRSAAPRANQSPIADYEPAFALAEEELERARVEGERNKEMVARWADEIESNLALSELDPADSLGDGRLSKELIVAILERSKARWKIDPQWSLVLARTALDLVGHRGASSIHLVLRSDLTARAHAYLGNSYRILDDFRAADREFVAAQAALGRGSEDPRERALVLGLLATLRRSQGNFPEALRHLQQAAAIYRWTGERHLEGQTYSQMAILQAYAGDPDRAIVLAERAADLIDAQRDPALAAGIEHNMTHFLCAADRPEEAHRRLPRARRLIQAHGTEIELRLLRWIEGQIALALGEREEGERILLGVRDEFIAVRNLYDTALVSLELAAEYLDQGRTADAKRLAEETLPIFQSLEIHRESLAALIAVQRAIELETATAGLVRELLESLRRGAGGQAPRPEKPS